MAGHFPSGFGTASSARADKRRWAASTSEFLAKTPANCSPDSPFRSSDSRHRHHRVEVVEARLNASTDAPAAQVAARIVTSLVDARRNRHDHVDLASRLRGD